MQLSVYTFTSSTLEKEAPVSPGSINSISIAAPFVNAFARVDNSARAVASGDAGLTGVNDSQKRIAAVEGVSAPADRQDRHNEQRRMWTTAAVAVPARAVSAGPQILAELIKRMGGAGIYSGPGRVFNIAV